MQVPHTAAVSASFDDSNPVSSSGLVPAMKQAEKAGLRSLDDQWLSVATDKGANARDGLAVLRHGGMRDLFAHLYAPSTLGS